MSQRDQMVLKRPSQRAITTSRRAWGGKRIILPLVVGLAVIAGVSIRMAGVLAGEPGEDDFSQIADRYAERTRPLMQQYCLGCHSTAQRAGDLDLEQFTNLQEVRRASRTWLKVAEMLDKGEMPPQQANQPSVEQRRELRQWIQHYLDAEALSNAGDPGSVVLRRLNNAEYTYTVQDLTQVDLNPARQFPGRQCSRRGILQRGRRSGDVTGAFQQISGRG